MATAQEQLMGMLNPQTARLLDNQMRQKQVAQRSQGAGMLSGLTQAYTGMADAVTGAAGFTPMGANEQQAIQANKIVEAKKAKALGSEQQNLKALVQTINSVKMPPKERAALIQLVATKQITANEVLERLDRYKPEAGKELSFEENVLGMSPSSLDNIYGDQASVVYSMVLNAKATGQSIEETQKQIAAFTKVETPNKDDSYFKAAVGIEVSGLANLYGEQAPAISNILLTARNNKISPQKAGEQVVAFVNASEDKKGVASVDMVEALGIPANILQGYPSEAVVEAYSFYNSNPEIPAAKRKQLALDKLLSSTSTPNTVSGKNKGATLMEVLGLNTAKYTELPTSMISKYNVMLHSPLEEGETTSMRLNRVRKLFGEDLGELEPTSEEIPSIADILGNKYNSWASSASVNKAMTAYNKGLLKGETVQDFRARIGSLPVPNLSDTKQKMYSEYEESSNTQADRIVFVGKAYKATDDAYTGFYGPAQLLGSKLTFMNEKEVVATEYINRIISAITLDDASKLKGAMSDKDLKFLTDSVGNKALNAESIKIALKELLIKSTQDTLVFNKLNAMKKEGDIEGIENFNVFKYLSEKVKTNVNGEVKMRSRRNVVQGIVATQYLGG